MPSEIVGVIGLGRLGSAVADRLIRTGYRVVCCARGRSESLVEAGATIPGDGSARAVAEACDVLLICVPAGEVGEAVEGGDGVLRAHGRLPLVVELSTAPLEVKRRLRDELARRRSDLLDCPVSGTPVMVEDGTAVMYASGDRGSYDNVLELLRAVSPGVVFLGDLGTGSKMKYVANLLALVHVTVAAEAMALARAFGLDLSQVADLIAASPAAVSGQFMVRGPMIAEERFDGSMVTIRDAREVLQQLTATADRVGARVPMAALAKDLLDQFGDEGEDDNDPGKLVEFLSRQVATTAEASPRPRTNHVRLYLALSRVSDPDVGPPSPDVLGAHLEWMAGLEASGSVFAAGPIVTDDGKIVGDGMYIVRAESLRAAELLVADDPMIRSGFRTCEVRGWEPHQGRVVLSATLTDAGTSLG